MSAASSKLSPSTKQSKGDSKIKAIFSKVCTETDKVSIDKYQEERFDLIHSLEININQDTIDQLQYEDKVDPATKFPPYVPGSYGYSGRHDGGFLPPKQLGGFYDALSSTIEESKAECDQYLLSWMESEKQNALKDKKKSSNEDSGRQDDIIEDEEADKKRAKLIEKDPAKEKN